MAQELINVGGADEKQGDTPFVFCPKINRNFTELYDEINNGKIGNRIVINTFSDFPEPLLPDKQYYIGANVEVPLTLPASWLDMPNNIEFKGSIVSSKLTWLGTGSLFNGGDMIRFRVEGVTSDVPNGTVYNIVDTVGTTIVNLFLANIESCVAFGTINAFAVVTDIVNAIDCDDGLVIGNKTAVLSVTRTTINSTSALFTAIDFSDSVMSTLEITNLRSNAPVGAIAIKGLPNSGNIAAGQVGALFSCELSGGITSLSGLTDNDTGYDYNKVTGIINSNTVGHCYIALGDEVVTVVTAGVEVPVAGTYTQGSESSQSTSSAAGVITMLNPIESRGVVSVSMDVDKSGGGSDSYLFKIVKVPISTGVAEDVEGVFTTKTIAGGGTDSFTISGPVRHIAGDQFYSTVTSISTNDNITANTQGFEVIG